jgi:hypothetical protein
VPERGSTLKKSLLALSETMLVPPGSRMLTMTESKS